MNKMMYPEMEVVRFDAEDVIATSGASAGNPLPGSWSPMSYEALCGETVGSEDVGGLFYTSMHVNVDDVWNYVDGVGLPGYGVLTYGLFYHFDVDKVDVDGDHYSWMSCSEEHCGSAHLSHHYSN